MKELSIEEKAKCYDEAIDVCRKLYNDAKANGYTSDIEDYEQIFPELKESEDERIRKEIISAIKEDWPGHKDWLAWLEAQGQDGKVWFYRNDYVRDKKQAYQDGIDNVLNNPQKYGLEQQGEQKPTAEEVLIKAGLKLYKDGNQWCVLVGDNIQEGVCGFGDTIEDALYSFLKNVCKTKQKPVEWSEEDEERLQSCLNILQAKGLMGATDTINTKWLKALKDRVQPKQEWSEEDEKHLEGCLQYFATITKNSIFYKDYLWLKSLRPQKQWKPSEEQMNALNDVISSRDIKYDVLSELWKDLKKLK